MTIDNLIEADVVLADGTFVTASLSDYSDLFWALRGGGGNFGVVTSFLFRAHPVGTVYGGPIFWDATHAKEVMQAYRDYLPEAPEELGIFVGLKAVPSMDPFPKEAWGKRACAIIGAYTGSADEGKKALAPILRSVPEPIFNWMSEVPFPVEQSLFDPFIPKGQQHYWKGAFVADLPGRCYRDSRSRQRLQSSPSELSVMHLYPIDGAVHRVAKDATAWNVRDARWSMVIAAVDTDPKKAESLKTWGRAYWEAVNPYNLAGAYVNFMMDDEADGRVQASYGENYHRLIKLSRRKVRPREPLPRQPEYPTSVAAPNSGDGVLQNDKVPHASKPRRIVHPIVAGNWRDVTGSQ